MASCCRATSPSRSRWTRTTEELEIEADVSFTVEVQERASLADQIERLRRLASDGVLSQEEFEAAKARILL